MSLSTRWSRLRHPTSDPTGNLTGHPGQDQKKKRDRDCAPDCDSDCGAAGLDALDISDCADCGDCDGCDGCDLAFLVLLPAALHYFHTAPVREGRRPYRPALRLIRSYQQHVSAHRPAVCNLTPTCSAYGYDAIGTHGWRGLRLIRDRLHACRTARHHAHS